jgi:hypothetical protein
VQVAGSWRAFSAAVMIAAALPQCSEASTNEPEPRPCQKQTGYTFECYTLEQLGQIADAATRDGGRGPVDAGVESGAAGAAAAAADAGATAAGPLLLSCPSPDGDTYPPLSGLRSAVFSMARPPAVPKSLSRESVATIKRSRSARGFEDWQTAWAVDIGRVARPAPLAA